MLGDIVTTFITGGVSLLVTLLSAFPQVDLSSLPVVPPPEVVAVLGFFNWFVPVADLLTIFAVWVTAVLAVNVLLPLVSLVNSAKKP